MPDSFSFDGSMPKDVLASYLAHAVTHYGIGFNNKQKTPNFSDDMRMFKKTGAKFIGRAASVWTTGFVDDGFFYYMCEKMAAEAHKADPEFLLQACVFEAVNKQLVDVVPVPAYVFETFNLPPEKRCFRYDDMIFTDGRFVNHWGEDCSVPDITRIETRLWFFYRASSYIKAGYEGIHYGQVGLVGRNDPDLRHWRQVIELTRAYAKEHARRHYVVIDAHLVGAFRHAEGIFDFNSFPIRLKEVLDKPMECICEEGYLDSMFNDRDGFCKPFLVEFDNFGLTDKPGEPTPQGHHAWGYDEITWFAIQDKAYRHGFLRYITEWVNSRYPDGWVQFPSRRVIKQPVSFIWKNPAAAWLRDAQSWDNCQYTLLPDGSAKIDRLYYSANNPSDQCPFGFGDEDVIAELIRAGNR
jgi:hypothetical protein